MKKGNTTWIDYVKQRIDRIQEGTLYMTFCDEEDWPVTKPEFDQLMNLVTVLQKERQLYMAKTNMILDLFDLLLNYNPKAEEHIRKAYKENLYDKIKLVKKTISWTQS